MEQLEAILYFVLITIKDAYMGVKSYDIWNDDMIYDEKNVREMII